MENDRKGGKFVVEKKHMLESRLKKFTKKAAVEKLLKIRRYRIMLCSLGLSMIVFVAYSIIFPVTIKEDFMYTMNDNQAIPLLSEDVDFTITKEKTKKPILNKEDKVQEPLSSKENQNISNPIEEVPLSSKTIIKKPAESMAGTKEKQEKKVPPETYPNWSGSKTYQAGERVKYKDRVYQANEENQNDPPDESHVLFSSSWDEVKE
jgi:hypothetical protein